MFELVAGHIRKISNRLCKPKTIDGFYKIKIINQMASPVWLAKDSIGNLHDVLNSGRSLEIRFPVSEKIKFFVYEASNDYSATGLEFLMEKEFTHESVWVIQ